MDEFIRNIETLVQRHRASSPASRRTCRAWWLGVLVLPRRPVAHGRTRQDFAQEHTTGRRENETLDMPWLFYGASTKGPKDLHAACYDAACCLALAPEKKSRTFQRWAGGVSTGRWPQHQTRRAPLSPSRTALVSVIAPPPSCHCGWTSVGNALDLMGFVSGQKSGQT